VKDRLLDGHVSIVISFQPLPRTIIDETRLVGVVEAELIHSVIAGFLFLVADLARERRALIKVARIIDTVPIGMIGVTNCGEGTAFDV
jgi:hypothetical protein